MKKLGKVYYLDNLQGVSLDTRTFKFKPFKQTLRFEFDDGYGSFSLEYGKYEQVFCKLEREQLQDLVNTINECLAQNIN